MHGHDIGAITITSILLALRDEKYISHKVYYLACLACLPGGLYIMPVFFSLFFI